MKTSIAETYLLIALFPEKGKMWISDVYVNNCFIGAIFFDLTLQGVITLENNHLLLSNNFSELLKNNPDINNNKIYSKIISEINNSRKDRKVKYWISKFASQVKSLRWEILQNFERNSIIRIEHKKFLGIIPYRKPVLFDTSFRQNIINKLHDCILYQKNLNPDTIALLNLINVSKIHYLIAFDKSERKQIKTNINKIVTDNPISKGVNDAINDIQSAIISAVVASSVAASVSASH